MKGTLLYYVIGPVHPRNMQLIAGLLPEWTFHMLYESDIWWFDAQALANIPQKKISFSGNNLPQTLDPNEYAAVIFSTIQPRPAPIALLKWALENEIPTIAIEEANQFGAVNEVENHYLLPLDSLLAASQYGRRNFIDLGVPDRRITVTGWPFYTGNEPVAQDVRRGLRMTMGLDPDRRVAILTLAVLNTYGETPTARRRQITMAARGLPPEFQLAIKPHPAEEVGVLEPFARECAPEAVLIDGRIPIGEVLDLADILLNRGVSQVTIEALNHKIPVVVLSMGENTIFHDLAPEVVAHNEEDVATVLAKLDAAEAPLDLYDAFLAEHIPYAPLRARELACQAIADTAENKIIDPKREPLWIELALYVAWKVGKKAASELLDRVDDDLGQEVVALRRLLLLRADRDDLAVVKKWFGTGYREHVLRCLWIDQLDRGRISLSDEDLSWMRNFPCPENVQLFIPHCAHWLKVLLRAKRRAEAEAFSAKLKDTYGDNEAVAMALWEIKLYGGSIRQRGQYEILRLRKFANEFARRCLGALKHAG